MMENNLKKLDILNPLVEATRQDEVKVLSKFLRERISHPDSYIVFLGETSSGKSSIINGLLGENILPVRATPSTAAITEIELTDQIEDDEYYAINKNATMEALDKMTFLELCEKPDAELSRLRLRRKTSNTSLQYARVFDTPGFGSIVAEHDEVLKEFLPNSDIVVYTIGYASGIQRIQNEDVSFLSYLKKLVRDDVEVLFVVNRCSDGIDESDRRIQEIKSRAKDILNKEPQLFCIGKVVSQIEGVRPLPECPQLWSAIGSVLSSPQRQERLEDAFDLFIKELYDRCDDVIQSRYINSQLDEDAYNELRECQRITAERLRRAVPDLIEPTFAHIKDMLPAKFEYAANAATEKLVSDIDNESGSNKSEMVAYINAHLLPHTIKLETDEIQNYIEVELNDLNEKVDDYIQKEIIKFNNEISIRMESRVEAALKDSIIRRGGQRVGEELLGGYFAGFGGAGGAGAGVANAASHGLKKLGDLFGKTFSRSTHNGLKHLLSKIGATSAKAIGAAVAAVLEFLYMLVDRLTWKKILKGKVKEGVGKWKGEALQQVLKDIDKLKEENIETMYEIARDFERSYDETKPTDVGECYKQVELSRSIGKKLGYLNY